ncbi:MAG: dolichyl-phosphate beta-glucosyltransferase [Terriglobales bacterium]
MKEQGRQATLPGVHEAAVADLSVVIPAYNEARRLPATLNTLSAYFAGQNRAVEVIVVDDGSSDGTGELELPRSRPGGVRWIQLRNQHNRGKGFSVRRGMLAASGERRLFTDADLSAPIEELEKLERALDGGADIAIGSRCRRELIRAHQPRLREHAGRVFNCMVRLGLGLPFRDTQCGFKLFRHAAAASVFPRQLSEGWGFDPELLFLARRMGFRIEEVPVVWSHAEGAKIHMLGDSLRMAGDILAIRRRR